MAKKNNNIVKLENIELQPQVIGYAYQKKSNIGRVIIIFITLILAVYFLDDITVWVNNLLGKSTPDTIKNLTNKNKEVNTDDESIKKDVEYNVYSNGLEIKIDNLTLNNFNYNNKKLNFDITNNSNSIQNLSTKKYFLETYLENKTLEERFKVDINSLNPNAKINYSIDVKKDFYYIVFREKTINDYPNVDLRQDNNGISTLTCTKGIDNILYTFNNNNLNEIKHTISDSDINAQDYYIKYNAYKSKAEMYNKVTGVNASFNGTLNGYTAIIDIDLSKANLETISEKYYFSYKEEPKVVNFEMGTYGFDCK